MTEKEVAKAVQEWSDQEAAVSLLRASGILARTALALKSGDYDAGSRALESSGEELAKAIDFLHASVARQKG